jgi:hypothetical protein
MITRRRIDRAGPLSIARESAGRPVFDLSAVSYADIG